jgi:hypothetical protein
MCVVARVRGDQIQRKQQSVGAILPEANHEALMNKYACVYLRCAEAFNVRLQRRQSMQLAVMDDALNYTCKSV